MRIMHDSGEKKVMLEFFFFFLGFIKKFPSQKNSVKIKSYAFAFSYLRRLPLMNSGACLGEVLRT